MSTREIQSGLRGVVAAETALSEVNGEKGELLIRGFPLREIAPRASYEEMMYLMLHNRLPDAEELRMFSTTLRREQRLPEITLCVLGDAAARKLGPMDALRMAVGTLDSAGEQSDVDAVVSVLAKFPVIVAAYYRLVQGESPLQPRADLGFSAQYLFLLRGKEGLPGEVRALETYLNTVVDHGLNASTFTARVITSTGSDITSALTGAIGALKGPLHGGAPGPALDMVFEIGSLERAEEYLRAKLEKGERLMGFGHRVYKVRDPRADVLAEAAQELFDHDGDRELYRLATGVEQKALELLDEYKPGRRLRTNVEFYTALVLYGLRLPVEFFTPTFAIGRMTGWAAHCLEQGRQQTLIRPSSVYNGPRGRIWIPMEER